jgi:hypothetical protein
VEAVMSLGSCIAYAYTLLNLMANRKVTPLVDILPESGKTQRELISQ